MACYLNSAPFYVLLRDYMKTLKKLFLVLVLLFAGVAANAQYDIDQFFARGRQMLIDGKYSMAIENFNILARLDSTL